MSTITDTLTSSITDKINNSSLSTSAASSLSSALSSQTKKGELGQDAFIKMLIEQLKNQDPTEPIKNEDMAVNLAQFSQVEKLTEISNKLGTGGLSDSASLAALLGREVLVSGNSVDITQGNGGSLYFELPSSASNATIELIDANGSVAASVNTGALSSGKQIISLESTDLVDGTYTVNVNATLTSGETYAPVVSGGGIVTGFIPGADPTLLIGNREIKAADIQMVSSQM